MILMILLVIVLMFYLQMRRPTQAGARVQNVSPAPDVEYVPAPEPPALDARQVEEAEPPALDDEYRASLAGRWRLYLFLALLAFLAAVVLLVWAASEVGYADRAIFLTSVSLWLLLLAGILFLGELLRQSLALAGVLKRDGA